MILVLNSNTAQDFWRLVYPPNRAPGLNGVVSADELAGEQWATCKRDAWALAPSWINDAFLGAGTTKLGCLARNAKLRRKSATHEAVAWSGPIPEGSLYDLGNDVYIPSPCFTFLQMALQLDLAELIAYGFELCGLYAFDPASPRGMRKRETPLCTSRSISDYLEAAQGCRGHGPASRAARFIVESSASPMETLDTMLLCMPYRLGGYGIPVPSLNHEVPLDENARAIANRSSCRADICYPSIHLDIEHQGIYDHAGNQAFDSDRARVNGLRAMGYNVIELTAGQVGNLHAFEAIALDIAKRLGKHPKHQALGALPPRLALRKTLFAWNRRYGHPK